MAQKFVYQAAGGEVVLDDPDNAYTPEQIKQHWAATFAELANASWDTKEVDGVKVVTFAKKVGTKGAGELQARITDLNWQLEMQCQEAVKMDAYLCDLQTAVQRLIEYRDAAGPLNFQLEKADDYINELRRLVITEAR